MKKLIFALLITMATNAQANGFYTGERVSGQNKICYYTTIGGTVAITISALEFCPMSIN